MQTYLDWLTRTLIVVFLMSVQALPARAAKVRPNIILIFTDDQGYQDLGCFGSPDIKTPHLDQMASEGMRLTNFYAQPVCGVSRAALMTGSYPIRIAEPGNTKRLHTVPHPEEVTMAEVLKSAGYATGIIGKWHLAVERKDLANGFGPATMPNAQGFDYFYGTPKFNGYTVKVEDTKVRSSIFRNEDVVVDAVENWDQITAVYTEEAISWITTKHENEQPFFLYLAHNMPHVPLGASEDFKGKSAGGLYGDTIEELDWSCGQIFQTLKQLNIDDDTLVVFTSDNGPWVETTRGMKPDGDAFIPRDHSGNSDPFRGWKMSAWEGACRVPFIARWPGKISAGTESDEMLSTLDLLPTFAAIAGAELPSVKLDGADATDFLTGKTLSSPRDEYLYYSGCLLTGVRSGQWKLVVPRKQAPAGLGWWGRMIEAVDEVHLFDLKTDLGETTNVASSHPDIVAKLMKRVERARTELGDIQVAGSEVRAFDQGPRKLQILAKKAARKGAKTGAKKPATKQANKEEPIDSKDVSHSFIAFGQKTYQVDGDGKKTWSYPHSTRDGFVLNNGNIVLTLNKGKRYRGGAVIEISPDGKESLIWKGTQAEINSAQPTDAGTFVITEAGPKPRLIEVDRSGKIVVEFPLQCQKANHHMETRMARKLADGTYLVPHLLDFAVKNYAANGKVLNQFSTVAEGDSERKIHTWPFTAIRHGDGQTLVCCTNGNRVIDFDSDGKIIWQLTNDDLPGPWLQDPCGGQVLPNGNVVITSYAGGRKAPKAPKLFEVDRDKNVVWKYSDGQKVGIHHFQILSTNGEMLQAAPMK